MEGLALNVPNLTTEICISRVQSSGPTKADKIGVSLAFTDAYNAAVKKNILQVTGCYEINNVNPWPKSLNDGSYTQAFQLLENPDLFELMHSKRRCNVWGWLDAGEQEAA